MIRAGVAAVPHGWTSDTGCAVAGGLDLVAGEPAVGGLLLRDHQVDAGERRTGRVPQAPAQRNGGGPIDGERRRDPGPCRPRRPPGPGPAPNFRARPYSNSQRALSSGTPGRCVGAPGGGRPARGGGAGASGECRIGGGGETRGTGSQRPGPRTALGIVQGVGGGLAATDGPPRIPQHPASSAHPVERSSPSGPAVTTEHKSSPAMPMRSKLQNFALMRVIGVGGGGSNAIQPDDPGGGDGRRVHPPSTRTARRWSDAPHKIRISDRATKGGQRRRDRRRAAEEDSEKIAQLPLAKSDRLGPPPSWAAGARRRSDRRPRKVPGR